MSLKVDVEIGKELPVIDLVAILAKTQCMYFVDGKQRTGNSFFDLQKQFLVD